MASSVSTRSRGGLASHLCSQVRPRPEPRYWRTGFTAYQPPAYRTYLRHRAPSAYLPPRGGGGRGEGGEGVLSVRRNPTSLGRPVPHRVLCGTTGTDMTDMKPRVSTGAAERAAHDKAAAMLQAGSPSPFP